MNFSTTLISFDEESKLIKFIPSKDYSAIGISYPCISNHKYLVIGQGTKTARLSFMNVTNSGWVSDTLKTLNYNSQQYNYGILTFDNSISKPIFYFEGGFTDYISQECSLLLVGIADVTNLEDEINDTIIINYIEEKQISYNLVNTILDLYSKIENVDNTNLKTNKWYNKKVLVIGDSITAAKKWQLKLEELLKMNVTTHAKGGVGTIAMTDGDKGLGGDYDNETDAEGTLYPLSITDVQDKDLIIVLPAYNDRGKEDGELGDCYNPNGGGQSTIAGLIQYSINRIYEVLQSANNLKCKILYATPHCAGKYPWIDADGYEDWPANSGRTMETLGNTIKKVCQYNNIPVCDLWHESGINKFNWTVFGSNPNAENTQYSPYELNSEGNPVNNTRIRYITGNSYYQWRDGKVVLEEYKESSPYPYNGDQLHCSSDGYARIGECICGSVIKSYGI